MNALRSFLNSCRAQKGNVYNMVGMSGCKGTFFIPPEKVEEYHTLFKDAIPEFNEKRHMGLIWRPVGGKQPLCFDIDFRCRDKPEHTVEPHLEFCRRLSREIGVEGEFFICMKPIPYTVEIKNEGLIYKTGAHLYFPYNLCDESTSMDIRATAVKIAAECYEGIDFHNSISDVVDACITNRRNGLIVPGCYKGEGKGGRYNIVTHGTWNYGWPGGEVQHVFFEGLDWLDEIHPKLFYEFALTNKREVEMKKAEEVAKKLSEPDKVGTLKVNVKALIRAFGKNVSNTVYKEVCMYLAVCDAPANECGRACNSYWQPNDLAETERFIKKFRGNSTSNPRRIEALLKEHAVNSYDLAEIMCRTKFKFYNEFTHFTKGTHTLREVQDFISDVFAFSFSDDKFVCRFFVTKKDRSGNTHYEVHTKISGQLPFRGNDNFMVRIIPSRTKLKAALQKLVGEETPALVLDLLKQECGLDDREFYRQAITVLPKGPFAEEVAIKKIVAEMHESCTIKRYQKIIFRPYAGSIDPIRNNDQLNMFTGFHLEDFKPSKKTLPGAASRP